MPSTTVPYHSGLTYGVGVDTPSGEARNIAVTGTPNVIFNAGGDIVSFSMMQIETVEDLHTALGISASASGGVGLFSASARFDYAQSCDVHEHSVFLMVRVKVTQAFTQIDKPGIDTIAADLLANGGVEPFQAQYGDMFVRGLETGGLLFATIQIFCKTDDEKRSITAKVSGSYAGFGATGQFSTDFHDTISQHETQVLCYIEGGDPSKPLPLSVDTMTTRAIGFASELTNHGVPYSALLDSYSILPLPDPPNYIDLQHQKDVLVQCSILRDQDLQALNNINYILSHPDQFIDPEQFLLSQRRNDLETDLNTIAAAASFALDHPKDARMPENLQVNGPIVLPSRKAGVVIPQVQVPNVMHETTEQAHMTLAAISAQFKIQDVQKPILASIGLGEDLIGKVVGQNPTVGTMVNPDATITLDVGTEDTTIERLEFNRLHHN